VIKVWKKQRNTIMVHVFERINATSSNSWGL
jgi:hypothetical protein